MKDNADDALNRLFAAARDEDRTSAEAALDRAEFGFETRLMSRLRREDATESLFSWAWRLVPLFAAIVIAAGIWSHTSHVSAAADASLIAELSQQNDERLLFTFMTGEHR